MGVLFKLSLLFWTPLLILFQIYNLIGRYFEWVCFERGRCTAFNFNYSRKFRLKAFFGTKEFLEYLVSSLNLKGDLDMARLHGIKPDAIHEFEPKNQENVPTDERLVFLCKFLDVNMSARITDQVYTAKGFGNKREELLRAGTQEIEILRLGLVGWKNFVYDDGTEVEWEDIPRGLSNQKAAAIMDRNLNKVPPEIRGEVADFIRGQSTPDQD